MPIFFTDLDDTLFSTRRKHRDDAELRAEAFLADGEPISYSCAIQRAVRDWMHTPTCKFIPVTARGTEAYRRTTIATSCFAVCANGAVILRADGSPDPQWQQHINASLQPKRNALAELQAELSAWGTPRGLRTWLVEEPGVGAVYAVLKSPHDQVHHLTEMARRLRAEMPEWVETVHHNDANLAVLPRGISKRHAVEYLRREHLAGDSFAIGVGDSESDWSFMAACDFALMPTGSQIAAALSNALKVG